MIFEFFHKSPRKEILPMARSSCLLCLGGLAMSVLSVGCVSQGRFDELDQKLKATEAELAHQKETVAALRGNLQTETSKSTNLTQKAQNLEKTISTVSQNKADLETALNQLKGDHARLKAALAALEREKRESDLRVAEYQDLLKRFQTLIDAGKLKVRIVDGRMVVALDSDVLFKSGSALLTADGQKAIQEVALLLASIPEKRFQVEGHTDNVPIASSRFANNWELAAARAISVVQKMIDGGVADTRISAASFGEAKPAQPNDTKEGRQANRRVEIVVVPDLSKLPGFDALQDADRVEYRSGVHQGQPKSP
jgi:chemotaxis protein MotB